jgi:hypothetical protein
MSSWCAHPPSFVESTTRHVVEREITKTSRKGEMLDVHEGSPHPFGRDLICVSERNIDTSTLRLFVVAPLALMTVEVLCQRLDGCDHNV